MALIIPGRESDKTITPGITPPAPPPVKPKPSEADGAFILNPDGTRHIGGAGRERIHDPKKPPCCEGTLRGACCDFATGQCREGVLPSQCNGNREVFYPNETCGAIDCRVVEPIIGACCDPMTAHCEDNVLIDDCPYEFWPFLRCSEIPCGDHTPGGLPCCGPVAPWAWLFTMSDMVEHCGCRDDGSGYGLISDIVGGTLNTSFIVPRKPGTDCSWVLDPAGPRFRSERYGDVLHCTRLSQTFESDIFIRVRIHCEPTSGYWVMEAHIGLSDATPPAWIGDLVDGWDNTFSIGRCPSPPAPCATAQTLENVLPYECCSFGAYSRCLGGGQGTVEPLF